MAALLVLAGAIAARAIERTREAAILKVLGASRAQVLSAYVLEYGLVGLIAGAAGVALGYAAAWPVVVRVFETEWSVDWAGVFTLLAIASLLAGIGGLLAAFQALRSGPRRHCVANRLLVSIHSPFRRIWLRGTLSNV